MSIAPPGTVDALRSAILAAGVLTAEELDSTEKRYPGGTWPEDPQRVLEHLERSGRVTPFQRQKLAAGEGATLVVGEYLLIDRIGAGGMGQVFKARHRRMQRDVALKVLPTSVQRDPNLIARFQREVVAAAKLTHPHVVVAYDAGDSGGIHYLVTEFIDGCDLAAFIKDKGPLPPAWAVEFIYQAALGLDYAHRQGVVHRDIKPSNFLLRRDGVVKVADLGLARVLAPDEAAADAANELTNTGMVMGTVDYMSPEQAVDTHQADARSDIYSLGCTLHYLLTGRAPFPTGTVVQKILAHREQLPPVLRAATGTPGPTSSEGPDDSDAKLVEALNTVFQRMVAKRPAHRFATMAEVMLALQPLRRKLAVEELNQAGGLRLTAVAESVSQTDPATNAVAATIGPSVDRGTPFTNPFPTIVTTESNSPVHRQRASRTTSRGLPVPWLAAAAAGLAVVVGLALWLASSRLTSTPVGTAKASGVGESAKTRPHSRAAGGTKPKATLPPDLVLDPAKIPSNERWPEDPPELVAVLGSSAQRVGSWVTSLAYKPDGSRLFSASVDGRIVAWDGDELRRAASLVLTSQRPGDVDRELVLQSCLWDAQRNCLWVAAHYGTLHRVDERGSELVHTAWWNAGEAETLWLAVRLSPDGRWLAALDNQAFLSLWNLQESPPTAVLRQTVPATNPQRGSVVFTADGTQLLAATDQGVRSYDLAELRDGVPSTDWMPPESPLPDVIPEFGNGRINMSLVGNRLLVQPGRDDVEQLTIWNRTADKNWQLLTNELSVRTPALSHDGRWLASANFGVLQLYDLQRPATRQNAITVADLPFRNIFSMAYRPDGARLVAGDESGRIFQFDVSTRYPREVGKQSTATVPMDVKWSPDGRLLAVCNEFETQLWELKDGQFRELSTWSTGAYPRGASWSGDGEWLAFTDGWSQPNLNVVKRSDLSRSKVPIPGGFGYGMSSCALSPNGLRLAFSGIDGRIHLWERADTHTHWVLKPTVSVPRMVVSLAFAPNSQRLAAVVYTPVDTTQTPHPPAWLTIVEFGGAQPWAREEIPLLGELSPGVSLEWSPDGTRLFAFNAEPSGVERGVTAYDMVANPPRALFRADIPSTGLCSSPDGEYLASAYTTTSVVTILSTSAMVPAHEYRLPTQVNDVDWHPSGAYLATANRNGTVSLLKVPEGLWGD